MIKAKVVADSVSPLGVRLTSMVLTYPRMVHAELMTHRALSRNAASSRAIPSQKFIKDVMESPAMPVWWGKNQSGMQAKAELDPESIEEVKDDWLRLRDQTVEFCEQHFGLMGLHKQIANRPLEPWFHIDVLVSATDWDNFFALRCHPDAQPEIQAVADAALWQYCNHKPKDVAYKDWHIPFADQLMDPAWTLEQRIKVGVARAARVSYKTFEGEVNLEKDLALTNQLAIAGHMSPFEHVATPSDMRYCGNFKGWMQYRKTFSNENRSVDHQELLKQRINAGSKFARDTSHD